MDDLRYPIGRFRPAPPDPTISAAAVRAGYIATLRALPQDLRQATRGLDDTQLDTPYREGGWTVRQVIHHVADSHANSYVRFKLALTEFEPTIKPYDEAAWAMLPDNRMPIDVSLALIDALHARWVTLLESDDRQGLSRRNSFIPRRGSHDLATTLALYAWHSRHHTAHITNLRTRMGW